MKILLYSEGMKYISKSGLGRAIKHQMKALEMNGIEYTTDPKDDFDLMHINTFWPKSYFLAKKCRKIGKKVVYHAHSTEEDFRNSFLFSNLVSPLFKKWIMKCYNLGDYIITPTEYSKSIFEGYGIKKPISAISNGIELDFFKYNYEGGQKFRESFGFSKEDKIVIAVGLYIQRKGILDFVELAKRMPEYKFVWFGYTPLYQVPHKVRKAVRTKLDNLYFPGYVEPEIFRYAYSGADVFLFPTYEETEGIVLLEALSTKQNVIVRDIPIFKDLITDGVNSYKAKDNDEFERKIKGIIKGELPSLKEEGYKIVESKNLDIIGKKLCEIYEKVLGK
ncbi:MAG: glycosyltransferase [Clostridia bacterium]|nr:glycosyltransferase [Clostridia bacterium]